MAEKKLPYSTAHSRSCNSLEADEVVKDLRLVFAYIPCKVGQSVAACRTSML